MIETNTNYTEETFHEARNEAFAEALENHDFGDEFVDHDPITRDGDIWSCKVYLDDVECDDTIAVSFMVEFKEDSTEVEYTSHDII